VRIHHPLLSTTSHPRDLYAVKKVRIHQYVQTDAQVFHWSVCLLVLAFITYIYTWLADWRKAGEWVPVTGEFTIASTHTFTHHHTTILTTSAGDSAYEVQKNRHEESCSAGHACSTEMLKKTRKKCLVCFLVFFL